MARLERRPDTGVAARADHLNHLQHEVDRSYMERDGSEARNEAWAIAASNFNDACRAFYEPYNEILAGIRDNRAEAFEEGVRYLLADPWCFRSGYLKADLMHALANARIRSHLLDPLRQVVVRRVVQPQPRLLRYAAQLASNVWSTRFEAELEGLLSNGTTEEQSAARALLDAARHRMRSLGAR